MLLPLIVAPSPEFLAAQDKFISYESIGEYLLMALLVVIIVPIADELLFRGLMLRAWTASYGTVTAMLLTSIATALFHTWEPFKLVHAFVMGILFASVVIWSRSVISSIMLHMLLNGLVLVPRAS